jgi:cellobiose-specific phosphotransferase system component IIA
VALQEPFLRYADWLLARALTLRETGNVEAAEKYVQRALECLDKADKQQQTKKE